MDENQLIRDGDADLEAFTELYRGNIRHVYCYHMVHVGNASAAEDLTLQTFMAALKEFPSIPKRASFSARIFEIAVEECRKDPRWSSREFADDAVLYYQASNLSTNKFDLQRTELESVSRAFQKMSADQAESLSLYFFGGLNHSEIGAVLNKSPDKIQTLVSRGLEDLRFYTSRASGRETFTSEFDDETLVNKLRNIASQIRPDPLFETQLEQSLAANYQPNARWSVPLQQIWTIIGWIALIGVTFFLLNWRDAANEPIVRPATARPSTQDIKKNTAIPNTPTPGRATASPTGTDIPLQEYTVQAGDTCTYIADKFGLTIDLLITLNHLNSTCDIWADQKLKVPLTPISP